MKNQNIAKIFYKIADYFRAEEVSFKPQAYEKAGLVLESLKQDIGEIYKNQGLKGLEKISGIGKSTAQKIEEYITTGKIKLVEELEKKMPIDIEDIISVEGVGPKKAKVLYQKLGITNLKQLEQAAKNNKIASLFGFGEKVQKNILEGINFLKRDKGRFLLGEVLLMTDEILKRLKKLKEIDQISLAGSIRRRKETIGDVDVLITTRQKNHYKKIMDYFVSLPGVLKVWSKGTTKSSVRMDQGIDVDIRVIAKKSYGSALQYFTGSKDHNIFLRKIAIDKKLKLNEYGLFQEKKMIAGWEEKDIYEKLGMPWIEPELRENTGEIEAALKNKLPNLVEEKDIKGDLHCHTNWSGGENTILEMVEVAKKKKYEYIGISDHTKFLRIENGLDEKGLIKQGKEIKKINQKESSFYILHGCEANILNDGSIDIRDDVLEKLDFVIAGIHSNLKMGKKEMTERIIKAIKNPNVNIVSHPTGRILKKRDEYQIDFNQILRAAKQYNVILEINSYPKRLDLNDKNIKITKEAGVKMIINTDAHHKDHLSFIHYGIAQARRGWAEKKDIINTLSLDKLLKYFQK